MFAYVHNMPQGQTGQKIFFSVEYILTHMAIFAKGSTQKNSAVEKGRGAGGGGEGRGATTTSFLRPGIFFQLAKQDICTTGFCIQLSIYINIESLSDTEKEIRPGLSGETDSFLVGVVFFKMFYSNHQLGPKRILSFSSVIKQCDKVPKPSQNS